MHVTVTHGTEETGFQHSNVETGAFNIGYVSTKVTTYRYRRKRRRQIGNVLVEPFKAKTFQAGRFLLLMSIIKRYTDSKVSEGEEAKKW